ncbi:DeoR/GlpR family DNA-binding transcription regulator [Amaricoccus sp.]|uniref:DeoR/GlpR family DNA-binding transcription regulator n=1 Tax=Amaricoccus sp. TaxID=1872485 RepID=UPI001B3FC83D|nr:DeoR/GlpR family DNA-binding transcription regulator [Amaricoccus sp.]MBP7002935.1 DeoR/GlpR transcriptional regulator [Amaricoccus sp.]
MDRLKPLERRERISAIVRQASRASVDELAERLNISRETVRRDLALLSEQGRIRKVHGGAVESQTARESPLDDRRAAARPEKTAIAAAAAALFRPGDSLLIDAGSTTTLFAEALGKVGSFSVITNSVAVAAELWGAPHKSDVYVLGGRYAGDGQEMLGPLTVEQIRTLRADHAVLTIGGMDEDGNCMDFNAEEAFVARAMIASAREVTVVADSSKLGRHALFQVCDAGKLDRLVTDRAPSQLLGEAMRAADVEVIVSGADSVADGRLGRRMRPNSQF